MSFSYDRYERQQRRRTQATRGTLGYWLPLAVTVTVATIGFAAWIWNERRDSTGGYDDDEDFDYERRSSKRDRTRRTDGSHQGGPVSYTPPGAPPSYQGDVSIGETSINQQQTSTEFRSTEERREEDVEQDSFVTRVNDAFRRTPSPQQLFNGTKKRVVAGVAAAGAAIGTGLSAISETKDDYLEHNRWEEEAENRAKDGESASASVAAGGAQSSIGSAIASAVGSATTQVRKAIGTGPAQPRKKGRLVVIVVSAATDEDHSTSDMAMDHASILSHIPVDVDPNNVELLVLIYAPHLRTHPLSASLNTGLQPMQKSSSMGSFSNISTPGDETEEVSQSAAQSSSYDANPSNALYNALQSRAATLTTHPTHVLPFTTPTGHVHLLKHLSPSLVYLQESLCGHQGEVVSQIGGWVGQVVVVVGAEGMGGGLVDTETEAETEDESSGVKHRQNKAQKWWMDESRVGLGKGVEVVESMRIEEDWAKRVNG